MRLIKTRRLTRMNLSAKKGASAPPLHLYASGGKFAAGVPCEV